MHYPCDSSPFEERSRPRRPLHTFYTDSGTLGITDVDNILARPRNITSAADRCLGPSIIFKITLPKPRNALGLFLGAESRIAP